MMTDKRKIRVNYVLFFVSVIVVITIILVIKPTKIIDDGKWIEKPASNDIKASLVEIKEDTLIALLQSFTLMHNSKFDISRSNSNEFILHIDRFSNNPNVFVSGNSLMFQSNNVFEIKKNNRGEIDARFKKVIYNNIKYVMLPTDVLFGLLKKVI